MEPATEINRKSRRGGRAKQANLPGMEDRRIKDIHSAAESYVAVRDERMRLTTEEVEAKKKLGEAYEEAQHDELQLRRASGDRRARRCRDS